MIRLATIGTSWITEQFIQACLESQEYEIIKMYSRSMDKAQAFADKFEVGTPVDSLDELFMDDVDVIYIASPNSLHYKYAIEAIQHHKHVIVEKPQFSTIDEWKHAHQLAKDNHVFIFDAVRHIHTESYRYLKDLVEYKIKTMKYPFLGANFSLGQYSSRYDKYIQWMKEDEDLPNIFNPDFAGGTLMDLGVYPLYIAIALFGRPEKLSYHYIPGKNGVDLMGTIILDYSSYMVTIFVSKAVASMQVNEIYVGNETIEVSHISELNEIKLLNQQGELLDSYQTDLGNPLLEEVKYFAEVIKGEANQSSYFELESLSYDVMCVLDELRQF